VTLINLEFLESKHQQEHARYGGGKSVFNCMGGGDTILDAGSGPSKDVYIQVY